MPLSPPIHIIAGPTASGKSQLALDLAQKSGGVIINADSQQVYTELRVLTARPSPEEEALVPHRLYGTISAAQSCSVGVWLKLARMEIDWALLQGEPAIVTGGTGMYIRALMQGIAEIPDVPDTIRAQAEADYDAMGKEAFHARLQAVDPEAASRIKDRQRSVRAYAVWLASGRPLSHWQREEHVAPYPQERFAVQLVMTPRQELYPRIDARFAQMVQKGALEEVEQLLAMQLSPALPAMRIIGVPELAAHLGGEISLAEAVTRAQQATRNYAKRQMTWFRNQLKDI